MLATDRKIIVNIRMSAERSHSDERRMARADEYRALARQCLQWAREATTNDVCKAYLDLERQWLEAASNLDGFPPVRWPTLLSRADEVIE
jgi:hypothetical protein